MVTNIKHIWFDLGETITIHSPELNHAHDELKYNLYAQVSGKNRSKNTDLEYDELYKKHGSNSSTFAALGEVEDFWQSNFSKLEKLNMLQPEPKVYLTLEKLSKILPLSLFTNMKMQAIEETLVTVKVEKEWFTNIISGDDISKRKPDLEGFRKMIEMSKIPAENIMYVGDRVNVDIKPAKEVGMKTCLVYKESNEADYSFLNFEDILTLFD